jgi:outer membrane biosynthesis protein TonB
MAKFERLEPRAEDMPVFDGSMDEEDGEEGSRLPLLIIIALLVLFAFAGVVYYAYTEGVQRGRADAPRVIVAQGMSGTKLKVYQQPAPPDDESADADSVPPPPSPVAKVPAEQTAPNVATAANAPPETPSKPAAAPAASPPAPPVPAPRKRIAAAALPPRPAATQPPVALVAPSATETASTPPANVAPAETLAKPIAGGSYLLQIGSYKSQDEAQSAWHAFQAKHPVVGGYQQDIKQVDLGDKGTWYRLRIGAFADKDAAMALCSKLKADGASCFMAK